MEEDFSKFWTADNNFFFAIFFANLLRVKITNCKKERFPMKYRVKFLDVCLILLILVQVILAGADYYSILGV